MTVLSAWLRCRRQTAGDTGRAKVCTRSARAIASDAAATDLADDLGPLL
ncbi:hypothetical protein [Streptomyces sp. NPDC001889]